MNYSLIIQIDQEDVTILKNEKYMLYVFQATHASGVGGITVWEKLDTDNIHSINTIKWSSNFCGYNSITGIENGNVIHFSSLVENIKLGDIIQIDQYGNLNQQRNENSPKQFFSFINRSNRKYTIGFTQKLENQQVCKNINCAFTVLGGNSTRLLAPSYKVALIFSTENFSVNTIIENTMSAGILVNLEDDNTREVHFDTQNGWMLNRELWARQFEAFINLSSLLIDSPQ